MKEGRIDLTGFQGRTAEAMMELAEEIRTGAIPPGGRLPSRADICARFRLTPPTVSKITARLAEEGYVVVRTGAGVFATRGLNPAKPRDSRMIAVMLAIPTIRLDMLQQSLVPRGFLPAVYFQQEHAWNPQHERQFLETALKNRVFGLIAFCSPVPPHNDDLLREMKALGTRVIHVEPYSSSPPAEGFILPDTVHAGRMAATEAVLSGYRSICLLTQKRGPYGEGIEKGIRQVVADHTMGMPITRIENAGGEPGRLEAALREFAEAAGKDGGAFLCVGEALGRETVRAAAAAGLEIPGRFGIAAVMYESPPEEFDAVLLSHGDAYARALDSLLAPEPEEPRMFLAPRYVRRGTFRSHGAPGGAPAGGGT